ncbi:MFS transporter [Mycobacterium parmense]|uniref:MFS transporter n=1 Tax=Mycobacterium parmense TaxID=185642 RepID=A0A7I7Z0N0_9MYCO|nr:MFS transporter [Mycobacterium parmense]
MRAAANQTRILVVAIIVSMVAFLDSNIAELALPAIRRDLGGGLSFQQWVLGAYLLALAATILPGGSISDLFGRIPVMRFGLVTFGTGSFLAAFAASPAMLIAGRLVQGLGAAFLVPGSLALINSAFDPADRPAAIGSWTAWTSSAFALGPLLGGLAVEYLSWRWIYAFSAIPTVIAFALTFWLRPVPDSAPQTRVDVAGAALSSIGLAATVYALIESQQRGWKYVLTFLVLGVGAMLAFVLWERRARNPMVPLRMFTVRNFAGANLVTAFVYGGVALGSLATALYLQEVVGYPAIVAGLITLPSPVMSLLFARRVGRAATRLGPKAFLVAGPVVAGLGVLLIRPSAQRFNILTDLLPGRIVLGIGLVVTITPLTALNLSAAEPEHSGIAAAIQNAVGRTSSLAAVGCAGVIAAGTLSDAGFARLLQATAVLFLLGAIVSAVAVTKRPRRPLRERSAWPTHPENAEDGSPQRIYDLSSSAPPYDSDAVP